jgi:hypothetical protein
MPSDQSAGLLVLLLDLWSVIPKEMSSDLFLPEWVLAGTLVSLLVAYLSVLKSLDLMLVMLMDAQTLDVLSGMLMDGMMALH